jgi:hypothetical protein
MHARIFALMNTYTYPYPYKHLRERLSRYILKIDKVTLDISLLIDSWLGKNK